MPRPLMPKKLKLKGSNEGLQDLELIPKRYDAEDELPRSVGAQYATGKEWRNNSRKNEEMEVKQKQCQLWI